MPGRGVQPVGAAVERLTNGIGALSATNGSTQSVRAVEGTVGERASGYTTDEEM